MRCCFVGPSCAHNQNVHGLQLPRPPIYCWTLLKNCNRKNVGVMITTWGRHLCGCITLKSSGTHLGACFVDLRPTLGISVALQPDSGNIKLVTLSVFQHFTFQFTPENLGRTSQKEGEPAKFHTESPQAWELTHNLLGGGDRADHCSITQPCIYSDSRKKQHPAVP